MADSNTHWSRIGESGTLLGMKLLLLTYRVFGRRGFKLLLYPVMGYYYLSKAEARAASKEYLQQVGPYLSAAAREGLSSFRHFLSFGEILLDKLLVWMGQITRDDVTFETPATIKELDTEKQGGIIIVSHLGNFEVCSALATEVPDLKLTILVYTRHAQKFNKLMNRVNKSSDVEIMQVTDISPITAMQLSERIKTGGYVVIAGDRTPVSGQKWVSPVHFLGRNSSMPRGAFVLAGLLKCPVYLMFCLKQQDRYHIYVELLTRRLEFGDRKTRQQTLDATVQEFALRLEHYCLKAPLQWFNFFPYWDAETASVEKPVAGEEREFRV